jgi:hypothetical protein
MGIWSTLFDSGKSGGEPRTKVREYDQDRAVRTADRYEKTDSGKHTHDSYKLDTDNGRYSEYRGGENSSDRGYNKDSGDK